MQVQSKACCYRPPVSLAGGYNYNVKGTYTEFNGLNTYVTGSNTAKRGIFICYDIFGLYVQSLRGADILASSYPQQPDDAGDFKVFMPVFFGEHPADIANYPPKTPPQLKAIMDFMTGPANPAKTLPLILPLLEAMKAANPQIESWAMLGYCWGGKIAALTSQEGTPFKASAQCHPSLLELDDATKIVIPHAILASMEEVPEVMEPWNEALLKASPNSYTETFDDMVHGFMSSRADFNNRHAFEEYLRGYRILRTFFAKFL